MYCSGPRDSPMNKTNSLALMKLNPMRRFWTKHIEGTSIGKSTICFCIFYFKILSPRSHCVLNKRLLFHYSVHWRQPLQTLSMKAFILYVPGPIQEFYQSECLKTEVSYFSTKSLDLETVCKFWCVRQKSLWTPTLYFYPQVTSNFWNCLRQQPELDGMAYQVNSFQFLQIEMCLNN